tara:strand:- start:1 stop:192 length:192 start_codon:yes stop_codon:yes gene_type:complete
MNVKIECHYVEIMQNIKRLIGRYFGKLEKFFPALTSPDFHLYLKVEKRRSGHQNHHVEARSLP